LIGKERGQNHCVIPSNVHHLPVEMYQFYRDEEKEEEEEFHFY
jgi:hypothetical protein